MLIIFLIVLIMFGAKKLPELAKGLGQAVREFSKAKEDMNTEIHRAAHVDPHSYHPPVDHSLPPAPAAPAPAVPAVQPVVTTSIPHDTAHGAPAAPVQAAPATHAPTQPHA
jgi:sec-independent protein translocase protein TatA